MHNRTQRIIITGAGSHSGKTTITCGILRALRNRGVNVGAYKTGADYIDTEYLRRAGQCEAYNLDTWLMTPEQTRELFATTSQHKDIAIIEGAMALYDGGTNGTAGIARLLGAPVVLVINAKSIGESAAAVALGFREYDRKINIAGVILNNTGSEYHEKIIADELSRVGIKYFGSLRRNDALAVTERHLGLLPAFENDSVNFEALACEVERSLDVDGILRAAESAGGFWASCREIVPAGKVTVGVARDEAFTFYYPESLATLHELGAEIVYFSPLHDDVLPQADGYIFGGGFPEIFARELSANVPMIDSVRRNSRPVLAECGGMMYLCRTLTDTNGRTHTMPGVIPGECVMTSRVVVGYMTARALRKNILCDVGEIVRGHEFHYSMVDGVNENDFAFEFTRRNTSTTHTGGYAGDKILASYLHTNFFGYPELAEKFIHSLT